MDRLFHSLIHLFGREEHDRLHADHASSSYGQRDGGRSRVVRHVKNYIGVVFAEDEIEPLEASTNTLEQFIGNSATRSPPALIRPFIPSDV
jgi:hypothetical protein